MGKYFGTDGFRGKANIELTADSAYKIGRFLGWYYGRDHRAKIVVGKDTRRSSYMLEYSLSAGIAASGGDVYLLHVTTTPSVSYIVRTDLFDCGVMISASHNAYSDNGIKLLNREGEKIEEEIITLIESYLDGHYLMDGRRGQELPLAIEDKIGTIMDYTAGRDRYLEYLISLEIGTFRGKKVALDCANGSAWKLATQVYRALGAEVHVINDQPNGLNINDKAGSTHIESLQAYVREHQMDIGFAFDGDADRCLAVDEQGNVVDGDQIMYLYARYMKECDALLTNTVVTTVMSNLGLYKALDEAGIDYAMTEVGDKNVYDYMVKHGNQIGGEQSGHIIFMKYARTGDGILTSLKIMEVMQAKELPLSKLVEPVCIYPQILMNVRVKDKQTVLEDSDIQKTIRDMQTQLAGSGRILVRASGTEPVIRIMVESPDKEVCRILAERVIVAICKKGYAVW